MPAHGTGPPDVCSQGDIDEVPSLQYGALEDAIIVPGCWPSLAEEEGATE